MFRVFQNSHSMWGNTVQNGWISSVEATDLQSLCSDLSIKLQPSNFNFTGFYISFPSLRKGWCKNGLNPWVRGKCSSDTSNILLCAHLLILPSSRWWWSSAVVRYYCRGLWWALTQEHCRQAEELKYINLKVHYCVAFLLLLIDKIAQRDNSKFMLYIRVC